MDRKSKLHSADIDKLRSRWDTHEGRNLRARLVSLWERDGSWEHLEGLFPEASVEPEHPQLLIDLRGLSLRRSAIKGAMLPFVDLSYASFVECNLEDVCLQGSKLSWAVFIRCSLKRSDLLQVVADHSTFDGSDLEQAIMGSSDFRTSSFRAANLTETVLDGANLLEADLLGARIVDVKARGTIFPKDFNPEPPKPRAESSDDYIP